MAEPTELRLERDLDTPYEAVESRLREGPERWLPGFALNGDRISGELAYERAGARIRRRTEVRVGPVQRFAYGVTVQIRWKGARHPELYPELEGHLRVEPRKPSGATLRFDARYAPPGGRVGATVDHALLHRVADATLRDFVDSVVDRLGSG